MSNLNLAIGGRSFSVACAAGEEDHITMLGRMIDTKLHAMGGATGQNETRMLLFAALLLADELHEAKASAPPVQPAASPIDASRLDAIASRLENLAFQLEN
jgi:cell division protein ZapA